MWRLLVSAFVVLRTFVLVVAAFRLCFAVQVAGNAIVHIVTRVAVASRAEVLFDLAVPYVASVLIVLAGP